MTKNTHIKTDFNYIYKIKTVNCRNLVKKKIEGSPSLSFAIGSEPEIKFDEENKVEACRKYVHRFERFVE